MKSTLLLLLNIMLCISSYSQVKGYVMDVNQNPIQEITIINKNQFTHTHTDAQGSFMDAFAKIGDTLQFTYIGFESFFYTVSEKDLSTDVVIVLKESRVILNQVNITAPLQSNLQMIDHQLKPVQSSQELLRMVPGLFISQHAGGGKAEQIFLRGFDLDHGTDINIMIDNLLPVNMVSHAHGQGYADLHFVIPESVKRIEYDKGSYNAAKGNFANAGYVDFVLLDRIASNSIIFETGKFDYHRLAGLVKLLNTDHSNAYVATEYVSSTGYFEHPQDFNRFNGLLKYNYLLKSGATLKLSGSHFSSKWKASGQIPQRAVDQNRIGRFGAIDPNEGGITNRTNLIANYINPISNKQHLKLSAFYSNYNFELFSNFTFFLNDSINGDQIKQKENRNIIGLDAQWTTNWEGINIVAAIGNRLDLVNDIELSHTKDQKDLLERKAFGDIHENNSYTYIKTNYDWNKWEFSLQSRLDILNFNYNSKLNSTAIKQTKNEIKFSPKLNIFYNLNQSIQLFAKSGLGFHTNDSRLLLQNPSESMAPTSLNADLGLQSKIGQNLLLHTGIWHMFLEDELVYVGDEAIVENSGETKRWGIESGFRYQLNPFLFLDAETSYTYARTIAEPEGQNYLPLAAKWTHIGGLTLKDYHNFSATLRYRILSNRPANENNSLIAKGYQLVDANINYNFKNMNIGLIIDNIFNQKWNEAQFATLSRLQHESEAVEEIHFTPGSPANFRIKFQFDF